MTILPWMSQATILMSLHSQRMKTPQQTRAKNSQKEENTLAIPSENVGHLLSSFGFILLNLFKDEQGIPPILICKIRKGQELQIRCIAKKVTSSDLPHYLDSYYHLCRVSQRSTQNGLLVPRSRLNMIPIINFATQRIGTKPTSGLNGPLVITLKKKNHHATMNPSILTLNPINFISKSRLTAVWGLKK